MPPHTETSSARPEPKPLPAMTSASQPDETHRKSAEELLRKVRIAPAGQGKFDALDKVVARYNESDLATKNAIAWLCLTYAKDKGRAILDRWPYMYVLAHVGYQPAVPDLIDELFHDQVECMRKRSAAEALGGMQ